MKIIDMHCDTISEIYWKRKDNIFLKENNLQIDINRLRGSNYLLQTFAIFVHLKRVNNPYETALEMIKEYYKQLEENREEIGAVFRYKDIVKNEKEGKISSLLSIEEGGVCNGSIENLQTFFEKGVRMMTLTWNFENQLAYPNNTSVGRFGTVNYHGLKEMGINFINEMERLGIIIDVSHLSDGGFYDVANYTKKPFIASHSNARSICPHVRNLTDPMIEIIGNRGGVIGINFYRAFVDKREDANTTYTKVKELVSHIKHIVQVGGIESVGLGTDFDGIDSQVEVKDCSYMYLLYDELKRENFSETSIEKIFSKNVLRVIKDIL